MPYFGINICENLYNFDEILEPFNEREKGGGGGGGVEGKDEVRAVYLATVPF